MSRFPVQTALTIVMIGAILAAVPKIAPGVKGPRLDHLNALADFTPERTPISPLVPHTIDAPVPAMPVRLPTQRFLLEDTNGGLDAFYAALWRSEKREPGAVTLITHYGDSPTTADLITGDVRAMLQQRFGDAGHGFILIAKPWAWY